MLVLMRQILQTPFRNPGISLGHNERAREQQAVGTRPGAYRALTRFQFDPDNADVVSSREVGDGRAVAFER